MMGHVPENLRAGLRELIIAVALRDSRRLVASVELIGVLLDGADTEELERSLTGLFARFGGMGFAQLRDVDEKELRAFSTDFESVVRDLPVQLPENLFLIIRSLSMVSGLCSSLNPSFNIWEVVEPYARELIEEEKGGVAGTAAKEALNFVRLTLGLPGRLDSLVQRLENGELSVATPKLDRRVAGLELLASGVLGGAVHRLRHRRCCVAADDEVGWHTAAHRFGAGAHPQSDHPAAAQEAHTPTTESVSVGSPDSSVNQLKPMPPGSCILYSQASIRRGEAQRLVSFSRFKHAGRQGLTNRCLRSGCLPKVGPQHGREPLRTRE